MTVNKVQAFAQSNGYDDVVYLKDWKGYQCYEPVMKGNDVSYIGLPLVILVQGETIRLSTPEEALKI